MCIPKKLSRILAAFSASPGSEKPCIKSLDPLATLLELVCANAVACIVAFWAPLRSLSRRDMMIAVRGLQSNEHSTTAVLLTCMWHHISCGGNSNTKELTTYNFNRLPPPYTIYNIFTASSLVGSPQISPECLVFAGIKFSIRKSTPDHDLWRKAREHYQTINWPATNASIKFWIGS